MVDEIERVYTVPFEQMLKSSRREKAKSAVKFLKSFLARHMKTDLDRVKLSKELNSSILAHGIQKPPRKIEVDKRGKPNVASKGQCADLASVTDSIS